MSEERPHINPQPGAVVPVIPSQEPLNLIDQANRLWTTFPVVTADQRAAVVRYRQSDQIILWDEDALEITCIGVIVHTGVFANEETGELEQTRRVLLVGSDGLVYATTSGVAADDLGLILAARGIPTEKAPIAMHTAQSFSRKKRRMLRIREGPLPLKPSKS